MMVDFRVHDSFIDHPKTVGLSLAAVGVWVLAGSWCARYLTDGYIPTEVITKLARNRRRHIAELVDHNLLQELEGGYLFIDWLQYQRSKQEIINTASLSRTRQARYRRRQQGDA